MQHEQRFLDGLAATAGVDSALLDHAGTTVIGRDDRAGSGSLACYRAGEHLLVWADPAVVDRVTDLSGPDPLTPEVLAARVRATGFEPMATVYSNLLDGESADPGPLPAGYRQRWLRDDDPETVPAVARFTSRCDPNEVEDADLEDLDDFSEAAITVVVPDPAPPDEPLHIVAYASGAPWTWDPGLADIGVLVHAARRRQGLARFVVAHTTRRLLEAGRAPLYRHEAKNLGSQATAAAIGFRRVARLDYFVLRP